MGSSGVYAGWWRDGWRCGMKKPIRPGLYYFHNEKGYDGGAQMAGSQYTATWAQLEPYDGQYDWSALDKWVKIEKERGHAWVLRIDVHQNRGARSLPGWVPKITLRMADGHTVEVPDYASPALHVGMYRLVEAVGARYDVDPDLVLVQIGLGLYGETHPERDDSQGSLCTQLVNSGKLTGCQWIEYCKRMINYYVGAFPTTELVVMNAPAFPFGCRATTSPFATSYPRRC